MFVEFLNFFVSVWILQLPDFLTYSQFLWPAESCRHRVDVRVDDSWLWFSVEDETGGHCLDRKQEGDGSELQLGTSRVWEHCTQPGEIVK